MIMPALPCHHAWRHLFDGSAGETVASWPDYRICDDCEAVAVTRGPYHEVVSFSEAKRLRLHAAYLKPAAERSN